MTGVVILTVIVAFFAATRTQVGRDELKRRLVNTFNSAFMGEVSVGRLTGNLMYTLYAEDVQLFDPEGELIASVDSVVIEPRWSELLRRSFSVKTISFHRPSIEISADENGVLNLTRAFATRNSDSTRAPSEWIFKSATLDISNGRITTRDILPTSGRRKLPDAFDVNHISFDGLDVEARVDWSAPQGQIDILRFSGTVADGKYAVTGQQGQLLIQGPRISSSNLVISIGESTLSLNGFANVLQSDDRISGWRMPFMLEIDRSPVSFNELKTLFPDLPFSGRATISALIQGPVSDATISWLRVNSPQSDFELTGLVQGLPDSAAFDVSISAVRLDPEDLRRWLPSVSFMTDFRMGSMNVTGSAQGVYQFGQAEPFVRSQGQLEITSGKGSVASNFEIEGPLNNDLAYAIGVTTRELDLSAWTSNRRMNTSLTGSFRVIGSGLQSDSVFAELRADLSNLRIGKSVVPAAVLTGQTEHGRFTSSLTLTQRLGEAQIDANGQFGSGLIDYTILLHADRLDLGRLIGNDSLQTKLNLIAELRGYGLTSETMAGELQLSIDTSDVRYASRTSQIQPHEMRIVLRPPDAVGPRLSIRGDVADVDVTTNGNPETIRKLSSAWIQELMTAIDRQWTKPLYSPAAVVADNADLMRSLLWAEAETAWEQDTGLDSLTIDVQARVHSLRFIESYWPLLPVLRSSGTGHIALNFDTKAISVSSSYRSDSLQIGTVHLSGTEISSSFETSRTPAVEDALEFGFDVRSDSALALGQTFRIPNLQISMSNRSGSFRFVTPGSQRIDSLEVAARIMLLEDRNEVIFDRLFLQGGATYWTNVLKPTIRFYSDALVVRDAKIAQMTADQPTGEQLLASGRFSSTARDTLNVRADAIALHELSQFFSFNPHLDGLLNARLEFTGGTEQPIVAGEVTVQQFTMDNRMLGDVVLDSRFIPGSPDLDVRLALTRPDSFAVPLPPTDGLLVSTVENQLLLQGVVRLPGTAGDGSLRPGALDLDATIDRADLFFLKYIFGDLDNISGFAGGRGTIAGSFKRPVFDVSLGISEGHFDIPLFNLSYSLEGDVHLERDAIRIERLFLTDPTGGLLNGSGNLFLNEYQYFTLGLGMELNEFQFMNVGFSDSLPFYGFLWASGGATLEGPLSGALLRSTDAVVTNNSQLFIPVVEKAENTDEAYIVFADSAGHIPDFRQLSRRSFLLGRRPASERKFLDALDMELSIFAPLGSTIHLVIDPLLGDVINATSTGHVQIDRDEGNFSVFGELQVSGGDYLFTAGEVFVRRFIIDEGGTITWAGDPVNAILDIPAAYRTRASLAGLPGYENSTLGLIPLIVSLQIGGTVESPTVELGLSIDRSQQNVLGDYQALEAQLNSPERATEYATSVLLTNTFRLTTDSFGAGSGGQLAFNSVSQLVSSQVNRFINQALPNLDFSFGLQGENAQDLDVTYGVALRLLDERLIIRGEGVYQGSRSSTDNISTTSEGLQGEFLVEVRLTPKVSVQIFFRREGDLLESADLTNTTGAGLSYQTEFSSWKNFMLRLFGWLTPNKKVNGPTASTNRIDLR